VRPRRKGPVAALADAGVQVQVPLRERVLPPRKLRCTKDKEHNKKRSSASTAAPQEVFGPENTAKHSSGQARIVAFWTWRGEAARRRGSPGRGGADKKIGWTRALADWRGA
jgi:hypothetical protein